MNEARSLGFLSSGTSLIVRSTLFTFELPFLFLALSRDFQPYHLKDVSCWRVLGLELSFYTSIYWVEKERVRTERSVPQSLSRILSPEGFFPLRRGFQTRTRVQAVHCLFGHYCTYIFLHLEHSIRPFPSSQCTHPHARTDGRTNDFERRRGRGRGDDNYYDWQEGIAPGRLETEEDFLRRRERRL